MLVFLVGAICASASHAQNAEIIIHLSDQQVVGKAPKELDSATSALLSKCDTTAMPDLIELGRVTSSGAALFPRAPLLMPKAGCVAVRKGPGGSRYSVSIFTPSPGDDAYLHILLETGGLLMNSGNGDPSFRWVRNPWSWLPVPAPQRQGMAVDFSSPLQPFDLGRSVQFARISREGEVALPGTLTVGTVFPVQRNGTPVDRLVVLETRSEYPAGKYYVTWALWSDLAGTVVATGSAPVHSASRSMSLEQQRLGAVFVVARQKVLAQYKAEELAPVVRYLENLASD